MHSVDEPIDDSHTRRPSRASSESRGEGTPTSPPENVEQDVELEDLNDWTLRRDADRLVLRLGCIAAQARITRDPDVDAIESVLQAVDGFRLRLEVDLNVGRSDPELVADVAAARRCINNASRIVSILIFELRETGSSELRRPRL